MTFLPAHPVRRPNRTGPGIRKQIHKKAQKKALSAVTAWALGALVMVGFAAPARAAEWVVLCTGYNSCAAAGYSHAGYATANGTSYWSQYSGHNCTNYVAYRMIKNGMSTTRPAGAIGYARDWGRNFASQTNDTPAVGSIAWWDTSFSSTGHVAYVEKVVSSSEVLISEDNWGGDFKWRKVTRTGGRWPQGFIHLKDVGTSTTTTTTTSPAMRTVTPTRVLDTSTGVGVAAARMAAGAEVSVPLAGRAGLPTSGVGTAMLNVTITSPSASGFTTTYPSGITRPTAHSSSYSTGATISTMVAAKVGSDGRARIYSSASTHIAVDVVGWYPSTGHLRAVTPKRVLDTRSGLGTPRVRLPARGQLDLTIAGGGVVPSTGASAVVLDLAVSAPSQSGWLTVRPTGTTRPMTTHVWFDAGKSRSNLIVVKIGTGGKVTIDSTAQTDVMVDIVGWYPTTSDNVTLRSARLLDTRTGVGAPAARVAAGSATLVRATGRGGVPTTGVKAVWVTLTALSPVSAGRLTAYRSGSTRPSVATVHHVANQVITNSVLVPVGADGSVVVHSSAATQIVVDVQGYVRS